jgi:hypothetical protein
MRTTYDFAPRWRSAIGFDRLFDLVDAAQQGGTEDVERLTEDQYQIPLAGSPRPAAGGAGGSSTTGTASNRAQGNGGRIDGTITPGPSMPGDAEIRPKIRK